MSDGNQLLQQGREEGWPEFRFTIGAEEFRKQRELILRMCAARDITLTEPANLRTTGEAWEETDLVGEEFDLLEGLQNLLDAIADQAHDVYGIKCLLFPGGTDE